MAINTTQGAFILLRRMRLPLIVLISVYAISTLGLVLIPGQDDQGNPWRMDFFHAFYFVSFMGSTIGFGEIPYPFTDAQRLWTTFALYSTVVAWLYSIGSFLSTIQSRSFQQIVKQTGFSHAVSRLNDPFYIICGYGDTSHLLLDALVEQGILAVVIDIKQENIDNLESINFGVDIPALCTDASDSESLITAGIEKPQCQGVLALTDQDDVNLMVAIAAKLIAPDIAVICRAESQDNEANMASFGTDYIVNPHTSFADRLGVAIRSPNKFLLTEWLTDDRYRASDRGLAPPRGRWILCGYGRFGKAFDKYLTYEGCEVTIIEAEPEKTGAPESSILGRGTEAVTLREANIKEAVGIIAGTDNDANNLSIIMTAQELNSDLFCVARQNRGYNRRVFKSAKCHWIMQPGKIVARKVLSRINMPLLFDFIHLIRHESEEWATELVEDLAAMLGDEHPHCWSIKLDPQESPGFMCLADRSIKLATILKDPNLPTRNMPCMPLLLKRGEEFTLTPSFDLELQENDKLLFCGDQVSEPKILEIMDDVYLLNFLLTGEEQPHSSLLRKLKGLPSIPKAEHIQ